MKINRVKKIIAVAGVAALLGIPSLASAADSTAGASGASGNIVTLDLYNLTDIHGHIEPVFDKYTSEAGLSHMSCYINKARQTNPNSAFTLLGDNIGASPFTSGTQNDNPTVEALNRMGVLASTIGNHEFDKGLDVLKQRIDGSNPSEYAKLNFPYLGANIKGMENHLKDYFMWRSPSGVTVAFIGAIEDDVATKLFPGAVDSLTFKKPVSVINELAKKLKTEGGYVTAANGKVDTVKTKADVVIAMFDNDVERSYPLMGKYVDGLMGGDTHKPYYFTQVKGAEGNTLSATASGSFTDNLSNLQIKFDKTTKKVVSSQAIQIKAADVRKCGDDPAVKEVVDKAVAKSETIKNKVISSTVGKFYRGYQESVGADGNVSRGENRGTESTLGGLIGDVMKNSFTDLAGKPIDIGMVVAGDIRADLASDSGKVTVGNIFAVMPWSNEISYVKMSGEKFKTLLEQQWKELGAKSSRPMLKLNFSQNVKYTYDPTRKMGDRITSILINGKPIEKDKLYTVAGSSFLMAGGDSFTVLTDPEVAKTLTTIPNKLDREWFEGYIKKNPAVQPRDHKSSIGVTVSDVKLVGEDVKAKVSLRGLSFSNKNEAQVKTVKVKFGAQSVNAQVDNTIQDKNAATYEAIVTTDGVGRTAAPVQVSASSVCKGMAGKNVHIPLSIYDERGVELVSATQGIGANITCSSVNINAGKQQDTAKHDAKPAAKLATTGADLKYPILAAAFLVISGLSVGAIKKFKVAK